MYSRFWKYTRRVFDQQHHSFTSQWQRVRRVSECGKALSTQYKMYASGPSSFTLNRNALHLTCTNVCGYESYCNTYTSLKNHIIDKRIPRAIPIFAIPFESGLTFCSRVDVFCSLPWVAGGVVGGLYVATHTNLCLEGHADEASTINKAIEHANSQSPSRSPTSASDLQLIAIMKTALEKGKLQEAAELLWDLLASPEHKGQSVDISDLLAKGRLDEATAKLSARLKEEPRNKDLHRDMAMALILKEKFGDALYWLDEALWIDPRTDADILFHRGNIMQRMGKAEEALSCFQKALIVNPLHKDASEAIPKALAKLGVTPDDKIVNYCRGVAYFDLAKYDESLREYKAAVSKDPSFREALYNASVVEHILMEKKICDQRNLKIVSPQLYPNTTHFEYAALAEAAYSESKAAVPNGWEVFETSDDESDSDGTFSRDGFFAIAFMNKDKQELVFAQKGTRTTDDIISDIHLFFNVPDRQYVCAKKFAERVLKKVSDDPVLKHFDVSFTGHSLGATQAEYLSYKFKRPAVTFESPGSLEIISKLEKTQVDPNSIDCLSFLARPNVVNTAKSHVGHNIRIYPPLGPQTFKAENAMIIQDTVDSLKKLLNFFAAPELEILEKRVTKELLRLAAETEIMLLETINWHNMVHIARTFRQQYETGIPVRQRDVVRWPTTESFYSYHRISRESKSGETDPDHIGELNREALHYAGYEIVERDQFKIPMVEFSRAERRFLQDYKSTPSSFDDALTDADKQLLDCYSVDYYDVALKCILSKEEWKQFVKKRAAHVGRVSPSTLQYWFH